jgi:hypothetical protein
MQNEETIWIVTDEEGLDEYTELLRQEDVK